MLRSLLAAALVAALLAPPAAEAAPSSGQPRLKAFESCTALVRYARRHVRRTESVPIAPPRAEQQPVSGGGEDDAAGAPEHSGTNVQEAGVDEPDVVKTDGARLFAVDQDALHAIDVHAAAPARLGSLALDDRAYQHELLLHGDRLLVMTQVESLIAAREFGLADPTTLLTEVDVSDPARMRVLRTLEVRGSYVTARLTGATARIVISSPPSAPEVRPSRLAAWMPRTTLKRRGQRKHARRLVRCRAVRRPSTFSGLDMITVLTVDMARGLPAVDADAVMTGGETVYASPSSLYVATQRWISPQRIAEGEPPDGLRTTIHRFDASQPGSTEYRSSGQVRGFLLSQWAMSEHAGHLRVASTETPDWWGGSGRDSESHVTALREDGNRLALVGRVSGLGRGERIYAVRFIGDVGYVVTFRETDPLYTVDLSDPGTPRVLGELKVLGYSAYLHPVGDGLLLGVGQDATEQGGTLGTQLSLFDVSDPARPVRLHQRTLAEGSSSEVEYDHRAFLYWPATGLTVVPYEQWEDRLSAGAIGFHVDRAGGIAQLGEIAHPVDPERGRIVRAVVVGDRLLTVSDAGVLASPLATLRGGAWLPFPK